VCVTSVELIGMYVCLCAVSVQPWCRKNQHGYICAPVPTGETCRMDCWEGRRTTPGERSV